MSGALSFTGQSIGAARRSLAAALRAAGLDEAALDARLLVGAALGLDHTGLARDEARILSADESAAIARLAARRLDREPVARILGHREFWGLDLELSAATLVPRPDTETVVEAARDAFAGRPPPRLVADLGTGSGAILLALLIEWPHAFGVGTDISAEALATAARNARRLGLAARARFVACDFAAALRGPFDLIVSNPPYIPSADIAALAAEVRAFDPRRALDGGGDGLAAYRTLVPQAAARLSPGGALVVEVGLGQAADVATLMIRAGLADGGSRPDLSGIPRAVTGLLRA